MHLKAHNTVFVPARYACRGAAQTVNGETFLPDTRCQNEKIRMASGGYARTDKTLHVT